jgi:hypothetical protein
VPGGIHQGGAAAEGLPEGLQPGEGFRGGVRFRGQDAGRALIELAAGGFQAGGFRSSHGVAADEGNPRRCANRTGSGEDGGFDAADIRDERSWGEAGGDDLFGQAFHAAHRHTEHQQVRPLRDGPGIGGGEIGEPPLTDGGEGFLPPGPDAELPAAQLPGIKQQRAAQQAGTEDGEGSFTEGEHGTETAYRKGKGRLQWGLRGTETETKWRRP